MPSNARQKAPTNGGTSKRPDELSPLRITEQLLPDGLHLFGVQGELEAASADRLAEAVFGALGEVPGTPELVEGPAHRVVVDLGRCSFIDSTGLGVLLRIARRLRGSDGSSTLALVEGQVQVKRVFEITRLDGSLSVFPTRREAIASLDTAPSP
jgi:anti-sigma B factor antagonist